MAFREVSLGKHLDEFPAVSVSGTLNRLQSGLNYGRREGNFRSHVKH